MLDLHAEPESASASAPEQPPADIDYVERNRAAWDRWAPWYAAAGRTAWTEELSWGMWSIPESELRLLEGLQPGADVVELGCGTASISGWLVRLGFRPVGIDISRRQLETAAALEEEYGVRFPLLSANAEAVHYDDGSFDLAISEYGASLWCDPHRWLPEARRILRPGAGLIFVVNGAMLMSCTPTDGSPAGDRLVRNYFTEQRAEFAGDDAVEFHPTHGEWVRLLNSSGFVLENLIETRPPADGKPRFDFASTEWARRWPSEEIWVARARP